MTAFTLVELLITIAIAAILIALSATGIKGVLDSGNRVKSVANLKALINAHLLYAGEHNGELPPTTSTVTGPRLKVSKISVNIESGSSPRQLFTTNVDACGQGKIDYLETVDVLYSPLCKASNYKARPKGRVLQSGSTITIGYQFYYWPRGTTNAPPVAELYTERMTDGRAPLYWDINFETAEAAGFSDSVCNVAFTDGSVVGFPAKKLAGVAADWKVRLPYMIGRKDL